MVKKLSQNFRLILNIFTIKKAAVVSNFCLIGKIHHNFLVPRMIRLQDFHAYSDLRSTQSEIETDTEKKISTNLSRFIILVKNLTVGKVQTF